MRRAHSLDGASKRTKQLVCDLLPVALKTLAKFRPEDVRECITTLSFVFSRFSRPSIVNEAIRSLIGTDRWRTLRSSGSERGAETTGETLAELASLVYALAQLNFRDRTVFLHAQEQFVKHENSVTSGALDQLERAFSKVNYVPSREFLDAHSENDTAEQIVVAKIAVVFGSMFEFLSGGLLIFR